MNAMRGCLIGASLLASGCATLNSYTNEGLDPRRPVPETPGRASLAVSAERGNPKVLVMLALSGGGSRAAYFSASVMLKLQKIFPERDLLREVDVISSVSGGSLAGAYYAISKDGRIDDRALADAVAPPPPKEPVAPGKLGRDSDGTLVCSAALTQAEESALRNRVLDPYAVRRVADLCRQAGVASNRNWDEATVKDLMTHDYVWRWIGNWFWPSNIAKYWLTSFDRSDLMAQTFADNLFDVAVTGRDLTFAELNPERPYLIINSTNATGGYSKGLGGEGFPFGAVFTFTAEDFRERIRSDLASYSVARAVMASAAFPVVFPGMTLRDYRPLLDKRCERPGEDEALCYRYLHVFDGGNSDNLGLATVKRLLFQAAVDGKIGSFDRIVVISVDAFTRPAGAPSVDPDSRGGFFSYLLDTNLVSAIDSLLLANRANTSREFRERRFSWKERECDPEQRNYPKRLCDALERAGEGVLDRQKVMDLSGRMVFYHIGFDDVGDATIDELDKDGNPVTLNLVDRLDRISTSLNISKPDQRAIDTAVGLIVNARSPCLRAILAIALDKGENATRENDICSGAEPEVQRRIRR
jgi:NTE family protein